MAEHTLQHILAYSEHYLRSFERKGHEDNLTFIFKRLKFNQNQKDHVDLFSKFNDTKVTAEQKLEFIGNHLNLSKPECVVELLGDLCSATWRFKKENITFLFDYMRKNLWHDKPMLKVTLLEKIRRKHCYLHQQFKVDFETQMDHQYKCLQTSLKMNHHKASQIDILRETGQYSLRLLHLLVEEIPNEMTFYQYCCTSASTTSDLDKIGGARLEGFEELQAKFHEKLGRSDYNLCNKLLSGTLVGMLKQNPGYEKVELNATYNKIKLQEIWTMLQESANISQLAKDNFDKEFCFHAENFAIRLAEKSVKHYKSNDAEFDTVQNFVLRNQTHFKNDAPRIKAQVTADFKQTLGKFESQHHVHQLELDDLKTDVQKFEFPIRSQNRYRHLISEVFDAVTAYQKEKEKAQNESGTCAA